jgi:hypothetical protein
MSEMVIFDRASRCRLPFIVRFEPKATGLLRQAKGRERK